MEKNHVQVRNTGLSGIKGNELLMLAVSFLSFITLGLHEGSLGVAWPSIRDNFNVPLDYLGMILVALTAGVLVSSFNSGWFVSRINFGSLLVAANLIRAAGLVGYVLAPTWWLVVISAFLVGLGAGIMDSGMNTYVGARYGAGPLNWLHACFGIGAMISPLIMTALITTGINWRWGFVIIVLLQLCLALYFALNRKSWTSDLLYDNTQNGVQERARSSATLRMLVVWLGIIVFFFSTGSEIAVGQWSFTLFSEFRGVDVAPAGLWVSIFWGSLTFGRILFGFITDRIGATRLLRLGMSGILIGILLYWLNPINQVGFIGLALIGFSVAPIFPVMIGLSPARFGAKNAPNAIGFQVASAYLGGSLIPALIGVVAVSFSLEVIGPMLFAAAVITITVHELLVQKCGL